MHSHKKQAVANKKSVDATVQILRDAASLNITTTP